ncbi:MAG TPA: serine/threonine protein kinase [Gammaproteobacteria bacterium]|nr:serine/threonine protein kinase [Gammaproteobacteria bacterium]
MPQQNDNTDVDAEPVSIDAATPYYALNPELILDAVEGCFAVRCNGSILSLNSYENRVYQLGIEDGAPLVAKFYRPGRWSNAAILEEHAFSMQLAEHEIPVIAPLPDMNGNTLAEYQGFRFAVFPCQGGRRPELESAEQRAWIGRFIGRIHAIGATQSFAARPTLTIQEFGFDAARFVMEHGFIPAELEIAYRTLVEDVLAQVNEKFSEVQKNINTIRLHGDCHPGNILWTDSGPHFVDFDDCRMGPAVQDIWMLLSGERREMTIQLADILDGYSDFYEFDPRELHLIEPLRTLRIIHYSAWLARRWQDPTFPMNFPWFNTNRYWEEQILALHEQAALLNEPPLVWS